MKRYDKDGNEVKKPILYDNWINGISPIWDTDLPIYKAYSNASTPQQMAERIKELESKVAYFNTLEFYDDQPRKGSVDYLLMSEQLKESQQEVKKLLSGISMIKDLYSLDAVYDKCIELLTKQNKEG